MRPSLSVTILLLAALSLLGCQTTTGTALDKKSTQGAIAGVLLGAAAGAAADDHKRGRGALIGAAVGGLAGGAIGHLLDRQAQEIDAIPDAEVAREPDKLFVAFPSDVLFDVGSKALQPGAYSRLDSLADSLLRHPDTEVVVRGHTDSTGTRDGNLRLSEDRADAVRRYLVSRGVPSSRVTAIGFGDAMPLASNQTAVGRQQNRRVEIEIRPSAALRDRAREDGAARPRDEDRYAPRPAEDAYGPPRSDETYAPDPYAPDGRADDRYDDRYDSRYDDPYEVR